MKGEAERGRASFLADVGGWGELKGKYTFGGGYTDEKTSVHVIPPLLDTGD